MPKRACFEQREVNQRLVSRHPYSMEEGKEESYKEHGESGSVTETRKAEKFRGSMVLK